MEKKEFIEHLNHLIDKKIDALQNRFDDLNNDLASDHKSSAGDKHETGRAMIQLEQVELLPLFQHLILKWFLSAGRIEIIG
jgi:archaellum component FlaC